MTPPPTAALTIPAKLNWDLRVLARRPDGYHELRSWFLAVGRYDRLVRSGEVDGDSARLDVVGSFAAEVPTDDRNLVLRAEDAWRTAGGEAPRCRWSLQKEIPHGAGLGGGSGDAAAALKLLQDCAIRGLTPSALAEVALGVGSDVPYFLGGRGAELRAGRGEQRIAHAPAPASWLVVAVPALSVSTAAVFSALHSDTLIGAVEVADRPSAQPGPNDLERAALRVVPELGDFVAALRQHADFVMSGSGSAFFAPTATAEEAESLRAAIAPYCELAFAAPVLGSAADENPNGALLWA
jgi:4-diphosphocytidyl-2-C-methyl-D-erythritol kinase